MLQQRKPDDYVIATGETRSVRDFLDRAFALVGLDWHDYIEFDPRYLRPSEVDVLIGDASKARHQLGWKATVTFEQLVKIMVEADVAAVKNEVFGPVDATVP
jgi:GDPmannose 4,6-dehydratase